MIPLFDNSSDDTCHELFTMLYDAYWKKVLRFARLYLTDPCEQEDVVQEVFIKLWDVRRTVNLDGNVEGLLFIMTKNLIFDRRRYSLNETLVKEELGHVVEDQYDIENQIDAEDLREYVDKLIAALPRRQREAFRMSRYDHLSTKEIAECMGISERGVERNIYLALKFLRRHMPLFLVFMGVIGTPVEHF